MFYCLKVGAEVIQDRGIVLRLADNGEPEFDVF